METRRLPLASYPGSGNISIFGRMTCPVFALSRPPRREGTTIDQNIVLGHGLQRT
jgi:hypothetical protein